MPVMLVCRVLNQEVSQSLRPAGDTQWDLQSETLSQNKFLILNSFMDILVTEAFQKYSVFTWQALHNMHFNVSVTLQRMIAILVFKQQRMSWEYSPH